MATMANFARLSHSCTLTISLIHRPAHQDPAMLFDDAQYSDVVSLQLSRAAAPIMVASINETGDECELCFSFLWPPR